MNISEWRKEVARYFPEYVLPAEIALSVLCQLFIKDITNPFGLVFVDVPSSGKTIILNFFAGIEDLVFTTDDFSPASFVAQSANRKAEELADIDMLPKIKDKVFLIRDLVPLLGKRDDDLLRLMGILTRVFDGEGLLMNSAVHGQRGYTGKYCFMLLAGCTPIPFRVWRIMGNFGTRLFFLNLNNPDKDYKTLAHQLSDTLSPKQKERKCREITAEYVAHIFKGVGAIKWDKGREDEDLLIEIARLAKLLACMRGTINVWEEDSREGKRFNHTMPLIEKADRINQSLYNLARGHAVAHKRTFILDEDIAILVKVVFSSAPQERTRLFNFLLENPNHLTADMIMDRLNMSRPSALKVMTKLAQLGIAYESGHMLKQKCRAISLNNDFEWFRSKRFQELQLWFNKHRV